MNIILFSTADWDNPFWTNKQHMAKLFAQNNHKVIYIDSLGIRKPTLTQKDFTRIFKRLSSFIKPYKKVDDNIWVITPVVIPLHNSKLIRKINDSLLSSIIKLLLFFLGIKEYIIWTYSPVSNYIIDKFSPTTTAYHCVDDLSALPNVEKQTIQEREKDLVKKADIIFTTSKNLYEQMVVNNKNTYYFNNVSDYNHFSKAKTQTFTPPKDIENIEGKKIVFIGAISSYKVNFDLLIKIASNNPTWNLIMIGKIGEGEPQTNISSLNTYKNIHFLGAKPYSELPNYLHYMDVAIIPANLNDYTKSMFPMKFFEYLSSGLQVVTTNLTSLQEYKHLAYISKTDKEFQNYLKEILEQNKTKDKKTIKQMCQENTWEYRYNSMMQLLYKK